MSLIDLAPVLEHEMYARIVMLAYPGEIARQRMYLDFR